jgi:DNA-binding FrmR family transcriptional regulator
LDADVRAQALRRLNYVSGHVTGIKKMIDEDRYCVDVLKQSYAVRKSLEKMEAIILAGHLRGCVVDGIRAGNEAQVTDELMELYHQSNR